MACNKKTNRPSEKGLLVLTLQNLSLCEERDYYYHISRSVRAADFQNIAGAFRPYLYNWD